MRAPSLQPPLVWQVGLLLYCAGILAALWPVEGLCAALLILLADRRFRTRLRVALAFALCAAGLGVGMWQLAPLRSPAPEPAWLAAPQGKGRAQGLRICGVARQVQGLSDGRLRVILEEVRPEAGGEALAGSCAWTWEDPAFRPLAGQRLCVSRRPVPLRGFANAPEPEFEARWAAQGVHWRLWSRWWSGEPDFTGEGSVGARLREALRRDLLRVLRPQGPDAEALPQARAIIPALLFGDRSFLTHATLEAFAAAGLAHSLALSGQHLALAGLIGLFSILVLARFKPGIYLFRARAVWVALASLPPALAYLWLGNAPASLLRAACMLGFMTLWLLRERTATALDALFAALGCIVFADPQSLFDLSLQLSVMCVAVICLWMPALRRLWAGRARRGRPLPPGAPPRLRLKLLGRALLRGLAGIFCVSLCIQLSLLPFMLVLFGSISLWFPLNVLWLPAVDLVVLPGAALGLLCSALGLDAVARGVLDAAVLPCEVLLACLDALERHHLLAGLELLRPHWTTVMAFACLGIGLAVLAGNAAARATARRFLAAGLVLLCVGPCLRLAARLDPTPRLELPDVGQGLATLLHLPGHVRLLMDGGGTASPRFDTGKALLAPLLADNDRPRLDAIINSHPDLDHAGGLHHLLRAFRVERLFHNGRDASGERRAAWREARELVPGATLGAGDTLLLGEGYRLEVLHPPRSEGEEKDGWTGNDASLVLRLTRDGEGLALFTGDAEPAAQRHLLASGRDLSARILVAPHHGSDKSFLPELYAAVRPELVLAGCGFRNRWGYPGKRLAAWLAARGIPLLDTGNHGRISVELPRGLPLRVTTARKAGNAPD
ncbi:MAG: DNA internalization-related competence protein ComEC/Rec2 [Desulfovibrio sp.]|nr:DNA internalization-related competence protein ComEC/Rec2 [Desulfovibrio sp.]